MRNRLPLLLLAVVAVPAVTGATEWYVVGNVGFLGDCMMEWRLVLAPPSSDPAPPDAPGDNQPSPYVALGLGPDGPTVGKITGQPPTRRLTATQSCRDGDPTCDADGTINNRCQFRLGMCFCVDDPAINTEGSLTNCWKRRQDICNPGSGFKPVTGGYTYTNLPDEPRGVYLHSPNNRNGKRWNDRSLENWERALADAGAVPAPTLDFGRSVKFRLVEDPVPPGSVLSETSVNRNHASYFYYPKRDPGIDTPTSCTELFDVHVPLVAVYDRSKRLTKFKKGQMWLRSYFLPATVDRAGDNLTLSCLPSAPGVNCTASLSRIDMRKVDDGATNYDHCWDTAPPTHYPKCPPPTTNVSPCDDYFPGCRVQDRWPGTPPACAAATG